MRGLIGSLNERVAVAERMLERLREASSYGQFDEDELFDYEYQLESEIRRYRDELVSLENGTHPIWEAIRS
jgi:hypothetical protein